MILPTALPKTLPKTPITAILFDLGGTLFEHLESTTSDYNLAQALSQLNTQFSALNLSAIDPPSFVLDYRRFRADQELELVNEPFFLHRHLVSGSFELAVRAQIMPPGRSEPGLDELVSAAAANFCLRQCQSVTQTLRPQTDMHDTLHALVERKIPMGVVSNIDEDYLQPLVAKHNLSDYFTFCLSSEVARSCKPDQSIFAQAYSRLPVQDPNKVLFVGDSAAHDVVGAQQFGMRAALLGSRVESRVESRVGSRVAPGLAEYSADYRLAKLAELLTIVGV